MNKGEKLKDRRKSLHLTLKEVATAVGVAEATVQRWESGNIQTIRADRLTKLSQILQLPIEELTGWFDPAELPRRGDATRPLSREEEIEKYIKEIYGFDDLSPISKLAELDKPEKEELAKILSEYVKLDELDRAKVRGNISGTIGLLLADVKYNISGRNCSNPPR